MARGIFHATMVTTVSPTYAREVMTTRGRHAAWTACCAHRHFDLHGVLNGLDYDVWNPSTDRCLAARFDANSLRDRASRTSAPCSSGSACRNETTCRCVRW